MPRDRFEGRPWLEMRTPALLALATVELAALSTVADWLPRVVLAALLIPALFVVFIPALQLVGVILLLRIVRRPTAPWDVRVVAALISVTAVVVQVVFYATVRDSGAFLGPTN